MYGLHAFAPIIQGRTARIWTDNEGARGSVTHGGARASDHNELVHRVWCFCYEMSVNPWFNRVPSDDNISDGPTRNEHRVVHTLGCCLISAQVPLVR